MCSSSPVRTPKLQLAAKQSLTGECWIPPKNIPHVQGQRRRPRKMVGGEKSHLESHKHHTCQGLSECSNKTLHASGDPVETEPDLCLSVSCRGEGGQWPVRGTGALGAAELGVA